MNSTAVIHLSKLDQNLDAIDRRIKSGVQRMAVIKDNAYGHGLVPIAKHISNRVEWFCVARAIEGKQLREAGITNPILVFEAPLNETASMFKDFNLTATLAEIDSLNVLQAGTEYQINIDTGMHRLGVLPEDVGVLSQALSKYPELKCTGVCLYGYGAGDVDVPDLEPILDWKSFLMQVKKVRKGESVSYGGKWIASKDGFIGVIPTGYSDGIPRVLTNSIKLMINEKLYEQAGVISMNYTIVFLGDNGYEKGTEVFFLKGKELSAKEWAKQARTIPYEITTSIKERVQKKYV